MTATLTLEESESGEEIKIIVNVHEATEAEKNLAIASAKTIASLINMENIKHGEGNGEG